MNKPAIENGDRGLTINKSLAWSILVVIAGGGIWVGMQVTDAKNGIDNLASRQAEDRQDIAENRNDIAALRSSNARIDQRLTSIEQSARRTEEAVSEILRYLRSDKP